VTPPTTRDDAVDPSLEQDEIRLTVPAEPASARIARQAAAALASRVGFAYDDLDRVRLGISEAWSVLLGPQAHRGVVEVRMTVAGPGLLEVRLEADPAHGRADGGEVAAEVLAKVAEQIRLEPDVGSVSLVLRRA
jgi:hypothetical protein